MQFNGLAELSMNSLILVYTHVTQVTFIDWSCLSASCSVNVKVQHYKSLLDELAVLSFSPFDTIHRHSFDTIRKDSKLFLAVSRARSNFWTIFIVRKVYTNGRNESQWLESNFKKTHLKNSQTVLREYVTFSDVFSCPVLHLVPVCLSWRCWTGFVNHTVRIARIIPRSCEIIKEVLPGTISPSSTETCVSPFGGGGWSVWTALIRTLVTRGKLPSFDMSLPLPRR